MPRLALAAMLALGCLALAACGDEDAGYEPEISNLTYSPLSGTAGGTLTVTGTVQFSDRDGDVNRFAGSVSTPVGFVDLERQSLSGTSGVTSGVVQFTLMFTAPVAGTYTFQIYLIDRPGNHSNKLQGTVEVE